MIFAARKCAPAEQSSFLEKPPAFSADWALFLDVDGTLLDIASHPDAVSVDPQLPALLAQLRDALGGALALVTGRNVAAIDQLFAPEKLPVAGQHGAERREAGGRLHATPGSRDTLRKAATQLRRLTQTDGDLLIEEKGASLAVHFRQTPELAGAAYDATATVARRLGTGYEMQTGKMVFEIKPSSHHKSSAIASFMREPPFRGRIPVFVGDDLTDEYGFELVNRLEGCAVKVGPGESSAHWRIANAASVRAWLRAYLGFLAAR